ncbi:PAS domain-containing protein [Ramlibacter algicola]|uniref:histidine kinase n=1 Tax=Ramlibacter algicola TaxID=2795217 RepID=A0A934UQI9_9BURK|nr:PAS domain-containing protein [Ramlibacter algicola]MBK0392694.1 PAS domain-containing protein [Ramlibacter algicola]
MAQRLRTTDWEATALGAPQEWDAALKTLAPIMLASNQPMFIVWGESRCLLYNDAYATILASKHPAALTRDFLDVWHEIRESLAPIVHAAYGGEPVQMDDIELWMERRGYREEAHFSFFYAPLRAESGEIGGFYCACNEITAQILAERRLSESESRHRGVLENMEEGFVLFDSEFNLLEVNQATMRMVQLPREVLIGRNHWELFPGTREGSVGHMYRQVAAERRAQSLEHLYRFTDGRERWFEVRAFPVADGIAAVFQDVTERRQLQEELTASFERVQLALDAGAIVGTWVWSIPEDRFVADERFALCFGLDPATLRTGAPISYAFAAIHPEDAPRVRQELERVLQLGGPYRCQYRVLRNGAYCWVEASGRAEMDDQGHPVRFPGVLLDVEERRRVEAERDQMLETLRLSDRRKDEFLAMLAHELRNPLAPISTAAQVLKLARGEPQRVDEASKVISRQVSHLTKLVDDLLDVSRVTRGLVQLELHAVDMRTVVSAAVEQVKPLVQSRDHELRTRLGAGTCTVRGDFHRLVQIVANLLNNAAKYTPQGGVIEVALAPEGGRAVLTVTDNGVGIAADMILHVFELFTQAERTPDRSQGGLGIGLALVRTLVQLHGGEVRANSPGLHKGSTFRVELPLAPVHPVAPEPAVNPRAGAARIFVVDDNVDAAETLRDLLELMGHSVTLAHDAHGALRQAAQATTPWDAFILDIGLPDMTGYELAQRLREQAAARNSTFVALTGYGQPHDRVISKASGFQHHLVKPADVAVLAEIVAPIAHS